MLNIIEEIKALAISDEELANAKSQVLFFHSQQRSTLEDFSAICATDELYGRGFDVYKDLESILFSISKEEVVQMAENFFQNPQIYEFKGSSSQ